MSSQILTWNSLGPVEHYTDLARYVLEGLPEIESLIKKAEKKLQFLDSFDPSFDAYVSQRPTRVDAQVEAIYEQLRSLELTYRIEPWDSRHTQQRIRLAREVLEKGHGCCLDLVLLLAGCLRHVGIYPLIVIVGDAHSPSHALLGYWRLEECSLDSHGLPIPIVFWSTISSRLADFGFVEATDLAGKPSQSFHQAQLDAASHLPQNGVSMVWGIVDIEACRRLSITSMPHKDQRVEALDKAASDVQQDVLAFLATFEHALDAVGDIEQVIKLVPPGLVPIKDLFALQYADTFIQQANLTTGPDFGQKGKLPVSLKDLVVFLLQCAWDKGYFMEKFYRHKRFVPPQRTIEARAVLDYIVEKYRGVDNLGICVDVFLQRAISMCTEEDALLRTLQTFSFGQTLTELILPHVDLWGDSVRSLFGCGALTSEVEDELLRKEDQRPTTSKVPVVPHVGKGDSLNGSKGKGTRARKRVKRGGSAESSTPLAP